MCHNLKRLPCTVKMQSTIVKELLEANFTIAFKHFCSIIVTQFGITTVSIVEHFSCKFLNILLKCFKVKKLTFCSAMDDTGLLKVPVVALWRLSN